MSVPSSSRTIHWKPPAIRRQWERQLPDIPLVFVESPYRALVGPLLAYLDVLDQAWPSDKDAPIRFVVVPEGIARSWWKRIPVYRPQKTEALCLLLGRKKILVADVPFRREL